MRCVISSRAGQILAEGQLFIESDEDGKLRLSLRTDGLRPGFAHRGKILQGGTIGEDGDLAIASEVLFRQFFEVWGMSDLTLVAKVP